MINMIENMISSFVSVYDNILGLNNMLFAIIDLAFFYYVVYWIIGLFYTRKFKPTENKHKYAICIAARNEEPVIGNLIASIKNQDYPAELLTIFVVADNCTDATAKIARDMGAVCYERFDNEHRTKGFALQFLFKNIAKDYGIENFEGYFIFDADNLLNRDYVTRMNEAFDAGEKIITSYRNTKNFDENWVASTYAVHWLRSVRHSHRARSVLRLATNIQGTGFLFANELVKNGWSYTSLTEDRAFTADAVAHGYPISYCDAAIFYDEQPTKLKVALRQRLRWSKGHLMAFAETGPQLFRNIIMGPRYKKSTKAEKANVRYHCKPRPQTVWKRALEQFRFRWASFDTLAQLFPVNILKVISWLIISISITACVKYASGISSAEVFSQSTVLGMILSKVFGIIHVNVEPGITAALMSVFLAFIWNTISRFNFFLTTMAVPIYIFVIERKRIIKIPLHKKILYTIMWPTFDAIGRWTSYIALFKKVDWKPIPHTSAVTIEQIENASEGAKNGKDKSKTKKT